MDLQPVDFVSGLGQLPDALKAMQQQQAFKVGMQGAQADTAYKQAQVEDFANKLQRQQMFQGDLQATLKNPDPNNISALVMKYPEYADQIKGGWDIKDKAAQQADLTQLGGIYSAASSGNWDLAAKSAQDRVDADKAAGRADPEDQQLVDMLSSGDAAKQKAALGLIGTHIAAVTGPEHFGTVFGALKGGYTLDAGATRYDDSGNVVAQSPFLKTPGGGILERDGANGSPATSSPPAAASTAPGGDAGFGKAIEFTLKHEGGYNPHDMNGAAVNFGINQTANPGVDVAKLTKPEATQIYKDKYWAASGAAKLPPVMQVPYFDTYIINPSRAEQFLAKSGGDPNKFMAMRETWMNSVAAKNPQYAKAYATRNADLRLTIAGMQQGQQSQPSASTDGAPPGYHVLVPDKGKDAPTGFQWSDDGKKLLPIPGGPADTATDSFDPETVNFYAQQILAGTPMSSLSFGMGKAAAANRRQVMTQVAHIAGAEGLSGRDQAIQLAHYKAGVANVTNLEKQLGAVEGNERAFEQNAQQVMEVSNRLPAQTGSRILNTPVQSYLRQTNDPTVAAMDVAIKTAANEYARLVTSSPSGAGTLSDSARQEYQNIIEGNFPLKQKLAALNQMRVDGRNRTNALRSNLQDSYKHLTDRAPELMGGGSSALPKGATVVGTYHGKRVIEVNGKRMVEQ